MHSSTLARFSNLLYAVNMLASTRFRYGVAACLCVAAIFTGCSAGTIQDHDFPELMVDLDAARGRIKTELPDPNSAYRGWDYLVNKLRAQGVAEDQLKMVYQNKRMPRFTLIPFSVAPKESSDAYKSFLRPKNIKRAREFLIRNSASFDGVEKKYDVSRNIIAAILLIETHFGQVLGNSVVIERLSRLASVGEPHNLVVNFERLLKLDANTKLDDVINRANYLEKIFLPEIVALFEIAQKKRLDIFEVRGSQAGAFGIPQFLPTSYLKFGVDSDSSRAISLFEERGAIWSAANYLAGYGWKSDLPLAEKREVVGKYNNSEAYVDAVFGVAAILAK